MWRADDCIPLVLTARGFEGGRDAEIAELDLSIFADENVCAYKGD